MQLTIKLNVKWFGDQVIVTQPELENSENNINTKPIIDTEKQINEIINFTEEFYRLVNDLSVDEIHLPENKIYRIDDIKTIDLSRKLTIKSSNKRATLLVGKENYRSDIDEKQNGFLFKLLDGADLTINNINICLPPQIKTTNTYNPRIAVSEKDENSKWRLVITNCDTTYLGKNGGFGIGVLWGSNRGNYVRVENFIHAGPFLIDAKNSIQNGKLQLVFDNVKTDLTNENEWNPYIYESRVRLTNDKSGFDKEIINGNYPEYVFELDKDITPNGFYPFTLLSLYNRGWDNRFFAVTIDKFFFLLYPSRFFERIYDVAHNNNTEWNVNDYNTKTVSNDYIKAMFGTIPRVGQKYKIVNHYRISTNPIKKIDISKNVIRTVGNPAFGDMTDIIEWQVGDQFKINQEIYTVIGKQKPGWWEMVEEFRNTSELIGKRHAAQMPFSSIILDKDLPEGNIHDVEVVKSNSEYLLDGEFRDCYYIYKSNANWRINDNEFDVFHGNPYGHLSYNHKELDIWFKDFEHNGYYRQSSGGDLNQSVSYNIINFTGFTGQWNPPVEITTDKEKPL